MAAKTKPARCRASSTHRARTSPAPSPEGNGVSGCAMIASSVNCGCRTAPGSATFVPSGRAKTRAEPEAERLRNEAEEILAEIIELKALQAEFLRSPG